MPLLAPVTRALGPVVLMADRISHGWVLSCVNCVGSVWVFFRVSL